MTVCKLTKEHTPDVARLTCRIKPDWWDYSGAYNQLSDISESIKTVGIQPNAYEKGFHLIMLAKSL